MGEGCSAPRYLGGGCGPLEFLDSCKVLRSVEATRATEVNRQVKSSQSQRADSRHSADGLNVLNRRLCLNQEIAASRIVQLRRALFKGLPPAGMCNKSTKAPATMRRISRHG